MASEELISLLTDWAKEKLRNKEEVIALLKRFGYERPENNFESLYAHSLVGLSNKHKEQLAAVLRDEEVIAAFRYYWTKHDFEPFSCQFSTRLKALNRDYVMPDLDTEAELKGFTESFRDLVRRVAAPTEQEQTALLYGLRDGLKRLELQQAHASSPDGTSAGVRQPAPSGATPVSNIPIRVPRHFIGRDDALARLESALSRSEGRVAIMALHGLRGVGKTTLAAAYAEVHRDDYRATWWIRAQTEATMRADLVGLGVRLKWTAVDEKEEPALAAVMEYLGQEGDGILLIYDNAVDAESIRTYLPRGGAAHVLVTSNAHAWRGLAQPFELHLWPTEIGADYLIARTGRTAEREAALELSGSLGGLPLAHEQAAAYCERLGVTLAEYRERLAAAPARILDTVRDAPADYHDRLTVAKTFMLAIDEAAKLNPAAEALIVHAALLAPEPIPLFLFAEAPEKFNEPLASALVADGLDEVVATLREFALVDRETIVDERDASIATDCIRLHRLVREVAAIRPDRATSDAAQRALIKAIQAVYPASGDPKSWPRARRLDALVQALVGGQVVPKGVEEHAVMLLVAAASYREGALSAYAAARLLLERALAICEQGLGPDDIGTATALNNLAVLLQKQRDFAGARLQIERSLAIYERALGPVAPLTMTAVANLGLLLHAQGDLVGARPLLERVLAMTEKVLGPEHPDTARSLNNLAGVLQDQGELAAARPLYERALAIAEKALGPEHPNTAASLQNLGGLLHDQGDLAGARPLYERAALGPEHPDTATSLYALARLLQGQSNFAAASPLFERALAIRERVLGFEHPLTKGSADAAADAFAALGHLAEAAALRERYGLSK